jgi:hypothetical protein
MSAEPDDVRLPWGIALTPVLLLVAAGLLARLRLSVPVAVLLAALVACATAVLLARRDRRPGAPDVPAWWAVVPWLYLGIRAVRRGGSGSAAWLPAVAGLLVWLFALTLLGPLTGGLEPGGRYDRAGLEAELAAGIKGRTGLTVTVRCPADQSLAEGADFRCQVAGAGGSTTVEVMVTDTAGHYTWRLD